MHVALGISTEAMVFPRVNEKRRAQIIARWSRRLLDIVNVRVSLTGEIPVAPSLLVANHVSWLDIFVINSVCPSRCVAKAEIRRWPVTGWLCAKAGTFFLRREKRAGLKELGDTLVQVLQSGQRIAVFPEGTTSEGGALGHFHASLLEPAVRAKVRVAPVALNFQQFDGTLNRDVAFAGEMSFWESVQQVLAQDEVLVTLHFSPPIESLSRNRRELAREAERAIASALQRNAPQTSFDQKDARRSGAAPTRTPYPGQAGSGGEPGRAMPSGRKSLGR